MLIRISAVGWSSHWEQLRDVRERVFVVEQGVPRELEWDGLDETAHHFLALADEKLAIGTARLLPTGQIGRMAVLAEHRRHGIGRRLLDRAVEEAGRLGMSCVFLHAQTHAAAFYSKAGFVPEGEEFLEAGIPHIEMRRPLPVAFEPEPRTAGLRIENHASSWALPKRSQTFQSFASESEARVRLYERLSEAERTVDILSPLLDHALLDTEECTALLSRVARLHAASRVRVLLADPTLAVGRGHRLVELARRLSSKIELRRIHAEPHLREEASFVVVDGRGIWHLPDHAVYVGSSCGHDPVRAERLSLDFQQRYEQSSIDPNLRRLLL